MDKNKDLQMYQWCIVKENKVVSEVETFPNTKQIQINIVYVTDGPVLKQIQFISTNYTDKLYITPF